MEKTTLQMLWKSNTWNNEKQNIFMPHLKPEKLYIPFISTL